MFNDLTHAWRAVRQQPAFSTAVIGVMALSIGACTAIFSIINTVLLTRLPYDPDGRLSIIWHTQGNAAGVVGLSPADYLAYRDHSRAFDAVAAVTTRGYNLGDHNGSTRVTCARTTASLQSMLRVPPLHGRWFGEADDHAGADRVVVLGHRLWASRFGQRRDIVGSRLHLDGQPYTIIGVMPASFHFPPEGVQGLDAAECWTPAAFSSAEVAMPSFNFVVMAMLRTGISLAQANDDVALTARRIWEGYPAAVQKQVDLRARVVAMSDHVVSRSRTALWMFGGAVVCLLLIGCANVANLMLARVFIRSREMAVRAALGASRATLVRHVLTESVFFALCGGTLGLLLAGGLLKTLSLLSPGNVPRLAAATLDAPALVFTLTCSVCAGLLFGLAPAWRIDADLSGVLASGSRGAASGFARDRVRSVLVVLELAMAVVLLTSAALLAHSFFRLSSVPPGFRTDNVLTFSISLPASSYGSVTQIDQFVADLLGQLRQRPSVANAAVGTSLPMGPTDPTVVARDDAAGAPDYKVAAIQSVSADFHDTFAIALKRGRLLREEDGAASPPVAVVNETMAHRYWPDKDVVGQRMQWLVGGRTLTIVGVVGDVQQSGLARPPQPTFYIPIAQSVHPPRGLVVAVHTSGSPLALAGDIRSLVASRDASLPIFGLRTGDSIVEQAVAPERFILFIVLTFAGAALTIAALGLYAVIAYLVSYSAREFGIRVALGASTSLLVRSIMVRGLSLVGLGLVAGLVAAMGLGRFMSSLLFGITPTDPMTFASVAMLLLVVSAGAIAVPAWRATRVDPVVSLRQE